MAGEVRLGGQRWVKMILQASILSTIVTPAVGSQIKRAVGDEVTLEARFDGDPSEINWKLNGDKVVDMELKPALDIHFYRFKDRATISPTNGSLTIRKLEVGDSGRYTAEALVNKDIKETHFNLSVIECPMKPNITYNRAENKIDLRCESETSGVTYEWWKETHIVARGASYTFPPPREDVTLTCVVYVDKDVCENKTSITFPPAQTKLAVGGDVTLGAWFDGDPSEINWKLNGNKVVDMELKPALDIYFYRFKDRATINPTDGSLTIRKMEVGDSGLYKAEAVVDKQIRETDFDVSVVECPTEPEIIDSHTENMIDLRCESETSGVTYEWWKETHIVAQGVSYTLLRPRDIVTLTCVVYVDKDVCKNEASIILTTECPTEPEIIIDSRTEKKIDLRCESETSGVTYEWWNKTDMITRGASYTLPPPKYDVTLTCVVYVDKDVCKNKNSITIPAESRRLSAGAIAGIVIAPFVLIMVFVACFAYRVGFNRCRKELTLLVNHQEEQKEKRIKLSLDPEPKLLDDHPEQQDYDLLSLDPERGRIQNSENKVETTQLNPQDSKIGHLKLIPFSKGEVQSYTFQKEDLPSIKAILGKPVEGQNIRPIKSLCLMVDEVKPEDSNDYTAEAFLSDEKTRAIPRKDHNKITFRLSDLKDVTSVAIKRKGDILYWWNLEILRLLYEKLILEPGALTIDFQDPVFSGKYKMEVECVKNQNITNTFTVSVFKLPGEDKKNRILLKKKVTPKIGHPKDEPIGNITLIPIELPKGVQVTWKKDGRLLDIRDDGIQWDFKDGRIECHDNGDLTINNVTSADNGTYIVLWDNQELKQEFLLDFEVEETSPDCSDGSAL